jgi:hypothetical protein
VFVGSQLIPPFRQCLRDPSATFGTSPTWHTVAMWMLLLRFQCEVVDCGRCVCRLAHRGRSQCEAVTKGVVTVKGKVVVGGGKLCLCLVTRTG